MRNRWWSHRDDEGFTLVEVIVALTLLAVVASGALVFFVRGTRGVADLQRRQSAVALASQALDRARSVKAVDLARGRDTATTLAQWAASSAPDLALGYPASQNPAVGDPLLPFSLTQRVSHQSFTVTTLVGTCLRPRADLTGSRCTRVDGYPAAPPANLPAGLVTMYRVVVEVSWKAVNGTTACSSVQCVYRVSTLVDPSKDPTWTVTTAPVPNATPRRLTVQTGTSSAVDLNVVGQAANADAGTQFSVVGTDVGRGTLAVDGAAFDQRTRYRGKVLTYTPAPGVIGTYTVTYFLVNSGGQSSSRATLTITVVPVAVADTARVAPRGTVSVPFGANDLPGPYGTNVVYTPGSLIRQSGDCTAGTPDAGGSVVVSAGAAGPEAGPAAASGSEQCVFSYTVQGTGSGSSLVSDATTITVTVSR